MDIEYLTGRFGEEAMPLKLSATGQSADVTLTETP
jgi:hypothetical protein